MIRKLTNLTEADALVTQGNTTVVVEAGNTRDLAETFEGWQLASSESLLLLLAHGADQYLLNDGARDYAAGEAIDLVRGYQQPRGPVTADNKQYVAPDIWPLGTLTRFCGAADDVATGARGTDLLVLSTEAAGDVDKTIRFVDPTRLAGGHVQYQGASLGDHVSFVVVVPPTAGTSVGAGQGGYTKVATGLGNIFVPYPGGGWDLDLDEKENAHVGFTKVRPVPSPGSTGYFDWDERTGIVTANASGKGGYHLFDAAVPLNEFVVKVPMMGAGDFPMVVPAVRPVLLLPHWEMTITLHNAAAKVLGMGVMLYLGKLNGLA
jgi:hypothetical protein